LKNSPFDVEGIRAALARLPEVAAQEDLEPPDLARVYVPLGHQQALSLDNSVVVGMRGAGKSLWTAVLSTAEHRRFVARVLENAALERATVRVGFGLDDTGQHFPSPTSVEQIMAKGIDPLHLWRWVVLRHALQAAGLDLPGKARQDDWLEMAGWSAANAQEVDSLLTRCDAALVQKKTVLLVLFDALDRLSADWDRVRSLIAAALRFGLSCRARRALRLKFFLRPDMEEDSEIWKFADSSKLRHAKVALDWRSADLYALILTYLANDADTGEAFRKRAARLTGMRWPSSDGPQVVPRALIRSDAALGSVVEGIAGEWMGRDKKRGYTYTWIPTHLADALGRVSPRSFLLAFKRAAHATEERRAEHPFPLHHEAIQDGVVHASSIRIEEIKEDNPWVEPLLEAAREMSVPCLPRELLERWTPAEIAKLRGAPKLPPRRFSTDPIRQGRKEVLIDDLVELAVLYRTEDGRLNMPDIFRVGFGIKRKGGVKPPR
jgi:hypothetical protein